MATTPLIVIADQSSQLVRRNIGPVGPTAYGVLAPLPASSATLAADGFLGGWQERSGGATIAHCVANLDSSGVLHNFRRLVDGEPGVFLGKRFADSDLYKTLEAIGWESLRTDTAVQGDFVDLAVDLIERTQQRDGYLNTYIQGDPSKTPWSDLTLAHELYCAGHLLQAAVALSRGAGDDRLLEVARRFLDRIIEDLEDRADGYDGHAEIETALVEWYRHTHDPRSLRFARLQVERRGHGRLAHGSAGREYFGDHAPFEQVDEAVGHAVRQLYFATGLTDLYLEQGDPALRDATERLWDSAYSTKTYITGGQGSRHTDESFGDPYELPPDRAYAETCAAIASFQWNWRMLLATGDRRYADEMETVLYNTVAASVAVDGRHFFYTNPLQMRTGHRGGREDTPDQRLSWFGCACCPPNLARLIASLHCYLATSNDSGIQIHHLAPTSFEFFVEGISATIVVQTPLPWRGGATVRIEADSSFEVAIRAPRWAVSILVNVDGQPAEGVGDDGYIRIRRDWTAGSIITLDFEIPATIVRPHPRIDAVRGSVAIRRGPFVYCLEGVDHPGQVLEDLRLDPTAELVETGSDAPEVVIALTAQGCEHTSGADLYTDGGEPSSDHSTTSITAIPYFAWGNRGPSAMRVWVPAEPPTT